MSKLVLSGSGVLYPVFTGAIAELHANGFDFDDGVCGTSGGSIIAAALACGYNDDELRDLVSSINPGELITSNVFPFGWATWPFNMRGIYSLDGVHKVLQKKFINTMGGIKTPLIIVTFDLELGQHVAWTNTHGIPNTRYAPNALVADLVRASMSIPIVFDHTELSQNGMPMFGKKSIHVDGGVGANFPLDIFGKGEDVVGLRFQPASGPRKIKSKIDIAMATVDGMIESMSREYMDDATYAVTCNLTTSGSGLDFVFTKDRVDKMIDDGRASVIEFLKRRVCA